jgi:hypothetical protein
MPIAAHIIPKTDQNIIKSYCSQTKPTSAGKSYVLIKIGNHSISLLNSTVKIQKKTKLYSVKNDLKY